MNYFSLYENLLNKHGSRQKQENVYMEKHHILPRSLGGSDEESNLIFLTPRLHYLAHRILHKMYKCKETAYAYHMMVSTPTSYDRNLKLNSKQIEHARIAYNSFASEQAKQQWVNNFNKMRDSVIFMFEDKDHPMYMKGKTGFFHPRGKPVVTPLGVFGSVREAAKAHGIRHPYISKKCKDPAITEYFYLTDKT